MFLGHLSQDNNLPAGPSYGGDILKSKGLSLDGIYDWVALCGASQPGDSIALDGEMRIRLAVFEI